MKKLTKITLKNSGELMSENEMRAILGGYSDSNYCYGGEHLFTCTTDFQGGYGASEGVVCATSVSDAEAKVKSALQNQGTYDSAVLISCS